MVSGSGIGDAALREAFLGAVAELGSFAAAARAVGVARRTGQEWGHAAGIWAPGRAGAPKRAGRVEYERLRSAGVGRREAARRVGVSVKRSGRWDQEMGITDTTFERSRPGPRVSVAALEAQLHPRFLTLAEREQIADLRRQGLSLRAIGRVLGRPASTIKRELDHRTVDGRYQPYQAQRQWAESRPRPRERKLLVDGPLREFVADRLRRRWSPQQICHALVGEHPHDPAMRVSTETIYQALYLQARGGLKREVAAALRSGRAYRKPRKSSDQRTARFVEAMVMISERPAEVTDRAVPGHWEGDLIMGANNASAILTLVERTTRYVLLGHLPGGHTATEVRDVLVPLIETLPTHLRGSLTWDQGVEMAAHHQFTVATGVPVYFCDPRSPWQRGSNENTNGLLRQYFPKGTDLSAHQPEDLEHVAHELNGRPRRTLDWHTPAERLRDLLTPT